MAVDLRKIFVGNLPWSYDEKKFSSAFAHFGKIDDSKIVYEPTGRSRGFGFLTFADEADAQKAMKEMNGKEIDGRPIVVSVAKNEKREFNRDREPRDREAYPPRDRDSYAPRDRDAYPPRDRDSYAPRDRDAYPPRDRDSYAAASRYYEPYPSRDPARDPAPPRNGSSRPRSPPPAAYRDDRSAPRSDRYQPYQSRDAPYDSKGDDRHSRPRDAYRPRSRSPPPARSAGNYDDDRSRQNAFTPREPARRDAPRDGFDDYARPAAYGADRSYRSTRSPPGASSRRPAPPAYDRSAPPATTPSERPYRYDGDARRV